LSIVEAHLGELSLSAEAQALIDASRAEQRAHQEATRRAAQRRRLLAGAGLFALGGALVYFLVALPLQRAAAIWQARGDNPLIALSGGRVVAGSDTPYPDPFERAQTTVRVDAFEIERTEVSNQQYEACMKAGGCEDAAGVPRFTYDPETTDLPVTGISAAQAAAYCAWIGRRLPTDLEWERAARGLDGRLWPWGDEPPDAQIANLLPEDEFDPRPLLPVDSLPGGASPEGVLNLAGNVWEWTATTVCEEAECPRWDGSADAFLFIRGGAANFQLPRLTIPTSAEATFFDPYVGFRCAADSEGEGK
jgi:formylglycine-generating enzyme required for sulfatase activity